MSDRVPFHPKRTNRILSPTPLARPGGRQRVEGSAVAPARRQALPLGQPDEGTARVGGVADQGDRPLRVPPGDELDEFAGKPRLRPLPVCGAREPEQERQRERVGKERRPHDEGEHDLVVAPGEAVPLRRLRGGVVVPGVAEHLPARAAQPRVIDGEQEGFALADDGFDREVEQHEPDRVGRPARRAEEAVGAGVMPDAGQAGGDERARDRVTRETKEGREK